jgi:putative transcriptional regulator
MKRHLSNETIFQFAAGQLAEPHRVVVRTHLALCADCAEAAGLAFELGGALLEDLPAAKLEEAALERTLERLDRQDAPESRHVVPTSVEAFAVGRWRRIAPGFRLMPLLSRGHDGARLDLIRVSPGAATPVHSHSGMELTCILQGGYRDETGTYHIGDFVEADESFYHQQSALDLGEDCICLIATSGRLRARGWIAGAALRLAGF